MSAGPAPCWASEHSKSLFNCTVQVSGLEALAFRHRSYCSICGLQRSLTALTGELRARTGLQTQGRLGAGRLLRRALLCGAGTQRLLQLVARGVPAARVRVYTVDVCTELGGAVPLDCGERGLHFLTGSSLRAMVAVRARVPKTGGYYRNVTRTSEGPGIATLHNIQIVSYHKNILPIYRPPYHFCYWLCVL